MLQQETPEDFVLATGEMHYVREFVEKAFRVLGVEIQSAARPIVQRRNFANCCLVDGLERASMRSEKTLKPAESWFESIPSTSVLLKSSERQQIPTFCIKLNVIAHRQLLGRPAKAERILGWKRHVDFDSLVKEMVEADLKSSKSLVEDHN
jgi:GDPmannose 4,6-dehydratase